MALQEEFENQGNFLFKYRGIIPLVFLLAGLGALVQSELQKTGIQDPGIKEIYRYFALFVSFFGLGIRVYTVGHTPKNTSDRNTQGQLADELNTTGIYSMLRHPLYLGNFFMWLGVAMLTENLWFVVAFIFLYWVYYERIMYAEERFLVRKFGEEYLDWANNTPAFIPSLKKRIPPKLSFSWKKVLKKEKNGFFEIFLVFFIFQCAHNLIIGENIILFNWLFYATVISVIIYLILKILKRSTALLDEEGR